MRILDRYLIRRFLFILCFALLAFIVIFVIVNLIEKLDDFIDNKVPGLIVAEYYLYSLPYIVILTLPVATLLASLFSIGSLAKANEIVAMKSSGLSLYRILVPLLVVGFFISVAAIFFSEFVLPPASEKREYLTDEYLEKQRERWRKRINKVYLRDAQGRIISMRYYRTLEKTGHVVRVSEMDGQKLLSRIDARRMEWEDSLWVLYDGYIRYFHDDDVEQVKKFDRLVLRDTSLTPDDFAKILRSPEEMSFRDLLVFINEIRRSGGDPAKWLVDLHLKIAIPFANFIIILFGAPLSSRKRRGSAATGFGISLAIVFIYFGITKTAQTLGHIGFLPPLFAAWIANILFGGAGLMVLIKTRK
jgi:lipopolysaccharide export system permease protein